MNVGLGVARSAIMHKIQFARGIGQREMLRANTLPSISRVQLGCFARIRLYEENARFILLALLLLLYLCMGAMLFSRLERDNELRERDEYRRQLNLLRSELCRTRMHCAMLDRLLELNANLSQAGLLSSKQRFDFTGSFFFSATVVSTIGFGMSTPRTKIGRAVTIIYGMIGCTCCVLFFNLFLERLVTCLTYALRYWHERKLARRLANTEQPITLLVNDVDLTESASSFEGNNPVPWRPSVYKVFGCLLFICSLLLSLAAIFYHCTEEWDYIDALYFCFISFGTVGFGDYVPGLRPSYFNPIQLYGALNFVLLALGTCCIYSMFNVSSIVVRQMLNWLIKKMDIKIERRKRRRYMGLGLRPPKGWDESERSSIDLDSADGLLSLKEFLITTQSNVVLLQKHLVMSAGKNNEDPSSSEEKISATRVGPMGILSQSFRD